MRDLRKDMRQYIDLRRALGYKLRKHEPRLTEFIAFLAAKGSDRITTRLAVAWATVRFIKRLDTEVYPAWQASSTPK